MKNYIMSGFKNIEFPEWLSMDRDLSGICYNSIRGIKYYRQIILCRPAWADLEVIKTIYKRAERQKKQVDHIVPLNNPIVCGLHCEDNMQLLTELENVNKSNNWWPDMPDEQLDLFGFEEHEQYELF